MGVTVTGDEADRKAAGVRAERERAIRDNPGNADRQAAQMNSHQLDRTIITNPKKGRAYHLVNRVVQEGARIQVLEGQGYRVTPEDEGKLLYGNEKEGGQVHGDLILMDTDQANFEARRSRERGLYAARMGEEREAVRDRIEKELRDSGHARPHKPATSDQSGEY